MADKNPSSHFMMPYAVGATLVFGGACLAELITRGKIQSPDNAAEVYAAIMAAYAGAGEVKGWISKIGPQRAEVDNPQLERARRGGVFVGFWLILYGSAYLVRLFCPEYPMPHELKRVALQIVGIFFVTFSARNLRRSRFGTADGDDMSAAEQDDLVLRYLRTRPDGATIRDIQSQYPDIPRRSLNRAAST